MNDEEKALTVRQPFAWLLVTGLMPFECRNWTTKYRGKLLIHAGNASSIMLPATRNALIARKIEIPDNLIRGAIIGEVTLNRIISCDELSTDCDLANYGRFCWMVSKPKIWKRPFFCRGRLGLFTPPAGYRAAQRCASIECSGATG